MGAARKLSILLRRRLPRHGLRRASCGLRRRVQRDRLVSLARAVRAAFVPRRVSRLVDQVVSLARAGHHQPGNNAAGPGGRDRPAGDRNSIQRRRRRSGRSLGRATYARLLVHPLPRIGPRHKLHVPRQQGRHVRRDERRQHDSRTTLLQREHRAAGLSHHRVSRATNRHARHPRRQRIELRRSAFPASRAAAVQPRVGLSGRLPIRPIQREHRDRPGVELHRHGGANTRGNRHNGVRPVRHDERIQRRRDRVCRKNPLLPMVARIADETGRGRHPIAGQHQRQHRSDGPRTDARDLQRRRTGAADEHRRFPAE